MNDYKLFGREPALWIALISSLVMFVSAFFLPLSVDQQGVLNAVTVAGFGLLTAWYAKTGGMSAAALGFIKAVLAVAVSFGINLSPDKQTVIMVLAAGLGAMFIRTQITPGSGTPPPKNDGY